MSNKIKELEAKLKNNCFSKKELDLLKSLDENELNRVSMLDNEKNRDFLLKAYFITFQQNVYEKAKVDNTELDSIISEAWVNIALKNTPSEIIDSYIGATLINTNLLSIIRENIKNEDTLVSFDKQIYDVYKELESYYKKGELLKRIYLVNGNISDDEILSNLESEKKYQSEKTIKEFKKLVLVWDSFLRKTKNEDTKEIDKKIDATFKRICFNFLPKQIFEQVKSLFNSDDGEKIDFAEMIHMPSDLNDDIVIQDDVKIKKEVVDTSFKDSFSSVKNSLSAKGKIGNKKNKIRFKKKPQKKSGLKFVLFSVFILSAISISTVFFVEKIANNDPIKISDNVVINDGIEAEIRLVEQVEKEEK